MIIQKKATTLQDIATRTNLSRSTISRSLNDHPKISTKTKKRGLQVAKELNYHPNIAARGLAQNKTYLICVVLTDLEDPIDSQLMRSIQDTAEAADYWVLPALMYDDAKRCERLIDSMMKINVDGFIFGSSFLEDPIVEGLLDQNIPLVQVIRRLEKDRGDQIVFDDRYSAGLSVNHLFKIGYRRVAIISGETKVSTSRWRLEGYCEAHAEWNIPVDQTLVQAGRFFSIDEGYRLAKKLMGLPQPPEAIFCSDDHLALGAMNALGELNLSVPEDVALVGIDDLDVSSHERIQLTTIHQDIQKMGKFATQILLDRMAGKTYPHRQISLKTDLKIRKSCGYSLKKEI